MWYESVVIWILIFAGVVSLGIALWNQPIYRCYLVRSKKVASSFRIVHLSDLHNSVYGKGNRRLIKKIIQKKPDIIVMTGDMIDDRFIREGAYQLVEGLKGYPMYFVSGNHEHWDSDVQQVFHRLEELGVIVLQDEYQEIQIKAMTINIAGLMDPARIGRITGRKEKDYYSNSLPERLQVLDSKLENTGDRYNILLSHRPEFFKAYMKTSQDLVLCGHVHGGQVRVPFLVNGIYGPNQGFFPKYVGGQYSRQDKHLIISRGLSFTLHLPRVFNPPEIVVIDVENSNDLS